MNVFILLVSLIGLSFANDPSCEEENFASKLALPNCLQEKYVSKQDSKSNFCLECGSNFNKLYTGKISQVDLQQKFFEIALDEYKKSLTNSLVEAVKLAALPGSNTNFPKSAKSCRMRTESDFEKNCSSQKGLELMKKTNAIQNIGLHTRNELAAILNDKAGISPSPTLLKRGKPACFIPERQLLYIANTTLEETLSTDLVTSLQKMDVSKYKSMEEFFVSDEFLENYDGDVNDFKNLLSQHPYLKNYFSTPSSTVAFFKKIKTPINYDDLRKNIYSKESGEIIDQKIAENCEKSFENFKKIICSNEFESGKLNLDPATNSKKLHIEKVDISKDQFSTSDNLIYKNIELTKYCNTNQSRNDLSLSQSSEKIAFGIPKNLQEKTFNDFVEFKYNNEFGLLNENLCKMTPQTCIEGTYTCKLFKKYQETLKKDSVDHKLANSFNNDAKELLRSMIGDTSSADPKTKEVLIAHGIIPKDDGKFVESPQIPEREPDYFAKASTGAIKPTLAKAQIAPKTYAQTAASSKGPAPERYDSSGYSNVGQFADAQRQIAMPDMSDMIKDNDELRKIQDEIRRRLTQLPPKTAPTAAEAKQIVRDSFKARGRSLLPAQEEALAEQMIPSQTTAATAAAPTFQNRETSSVAAPNRAAVSNTDTELQKWKKNQANAALMGMAGAQSAAGNEKSSPGEAGVAPEKTMSKVALNIPLDPKVKLAEVFANKLHTNDPETQLLKVLLKNRSNFVLQINSNNFKVMFSEKDQFNLLLESGDKDEASRIRPQLEIFLKRLKV